MEFIIAGIIAVCLVAAIIKKVCDIKNGCGCGCLECKKDGRCGK